MFCGRIQLSELPSRAIPSSSSPRWQGEHRRIATLLGDRLRAARLSTGLSQERLARVARLHRTEVGAIERGERVPSLSTLLVLAHELGLDAGDLIRDLPVPRERRALAV
ncbi:MAG: helix-turn-helix domain-containing protein [Solirubrobacteraceae bacterium]